MFQEDAVDGMPNHPINQLCSLPLHSSCMCNEHLQLKMVAAMALVGMPWMVVALIVFTWLLFFTMAYHDVHGCFVAMEHISPMAYHEHPWIFFYHGSVFTMAFF